MEFLWIDSFNLYNSEQVHEHYNIVRSVNITAGGRYGNRLAGEIHKVLPSTYNNLTVGCCVKHLDDPRQADVFLLHTVEGDELCRLCIGNDCRLRVKRGTTVLGSSSSDLKTGIWYNLQFSITAGLAGSFAVWLDNIKVIDVPSVQLIAGGLDTCGIVQLGLYDIVPQWFDDFWVATGTGTYLENYAGDVRIESALPAGNGMISQFTGSDGNGVDNFLLVQESPPDAVAVVRGDVGNEEDYEFQDCAYEQGTVSILAVAIKRRMRKTDAGTRLVLPRRYLGTEVTYGAEVSLQNSWNTFAEVLNTTPETGGHNWDVAHRNALFAGIKVSA